ncbi:MAG TPA: phosphate ABC transporter permease subunit PstC [Leucothrix mucor]|nr:phosphate ABC transporter permease subunit PstC [Leucothrix mucor]
MPIKFLLVTLLALLLFSYVIGRKRSLALKANNSGAKQALHSLPKYYGFLVALWAGIPALVILLLWAMFDTTIITSMTISQLPVETQQLSQDDLGLLMNEVKNLSQSATLSDATTDAKSLIKQAAANNFNRFNSINSLAKTVVVLVIALIGLVLGLRYIRAETRARNHVESAIKLLMMACASIAILTTFGIIFSVLFESLQFFKTIPVTEFLFGTTWSPQTAIRPDQIGSSGSFGAVPLFVGTLLIASIALIVAVPLGLMSAIYLSEYASARVRTVVKPMLEILAGIPTVVYGFFAALTVAPFIRDVGESIGFSPSSESALAAGLVMGVMIIPFVSSLSDDVLSAVPQAMRDGSYAMGATHSETIKKVVIPAALPGIVGGVLLAASRAIGETMIVVMAAGLAANLTVNPMEAVTTVTVQIVTLLTGDQEFDSPKTLAAFALGLGLFLVTLILNVISLHIVRKYREQYE